MQYTFETVPNKTLFTYGGSRFAKNKDGEIYRISKKGTISRIRYASTTQYLNRVVKIAK